MAAVQKPTGPTGPAAAKANQSPTNKAAADKAAAEKKGVDDKKAADKKAADKKAADKPPADPPLTLWGDSPLKAQKHWDKGVPLQAPIKIMPISGRYVGLTWEIGGPNSWLGLAVEKVSQSYGADWKPVTAGKFAPGVSFDKLAEQKFSLKTSFFDLNQDISHLTEGLKHLTEVSGSEITPPILIYLQGDIQCHVVLTSVKVEYAEGLGGSKRGFRQAESVDLDFLVVAGPGSGNAYLGGALTATPQEALAAKKTDKQRLRDGAKAVVDNALGNCLGRQSRAAILNLIERDKMEDVPSLVALDTEAFVTMAMAGKIPAATLNGNPQLKARFAESLAVFLAGREQGIARDRQGDSAGGRSIGLVAGPKKALVAYYQANDAAAPALFVAIGNRDLQEQAANGRSSYQKILTAALAGTVDSVESGLQEAGTPAAQRMKAFSCAFQLSKANLSQVTGSSDAADPQTIIKMNTFIDKHKAMNGDDVKEYQKAFGLKDEGQVLRLKQVLPAFSRADFETKVNQKFGSGSGISGAALFSKFIGYTPPP